MKKLLFLNGSFFLFFNIIVNIVFSQDIKQADSLLILQKNSEALAIYQKLFEKDSLNENALRGLGFIYMHSNNKNEIELANKYYSKAFSLNNKCINCLFHLAYIQIKLGNTENYQHYSSLYLKNITEQNKLDSQIQNLHKLKYYYAMNNKNYNNAFLALEEMEKVIHNQSELYYFRGQTYLTQGKYIEAIKAYKQSLKTATEKESIYNELALCYEGINDDEMALINYNLAININENNPEYLNSRGKLLMKMGYSKDAIKDFHNSLQLKPNPYTYYYISNSYFSLQDMDSASLYNTLAIKYFSYEKYNDTLFIDYLKRMDYYISNPSNFSYYLQRAMAANELKNYQAAIEYCNQGLEKFNGDAIFLTFRGNYYFQLGDLNNAYKDFKAYHIRYEEAKKRFLELGENYGTFTFSSAANMAEYYRLVNCRLLIECGMELGNYSECFGFIEEGKKMSNDSIISNGLNVFKMLESKIHFIKKNYLACIAICNEIIEKDISNPAYFMIRCEARLNLAFQNHFDEIVTLIHTDSSLSNPSLIYPFVKANALNEREIMLALSDLEICKELGYINNNVLFLSGCLKWSLNGSQGDPCIEFGLLRDNGFLIREELLSQCK